MGGIIEALLDIEQQAETALNSSQREKERLPARIAAEKEHIRQVIAQETEATIRELHENFKKATSYRLNVIAESSARQLDELEAGFNSQKGELRRELFQKLTKWN